MYHLGLSSGRFGLGQAPPGDVTQDPGYQSAWGTVMGQLNAEGASSTDIQGAAYALQSSWDTLVGQGMSGSDALGAATKYVMNVQTIGGAADLVSGLVSAGQSGVPAAGLLETATGTMIGAMVLAGAVSAGVGAAIVGAADVLVTLLQASGLFGSAPSGQSYCGNLTVSGPGPSYMLPGQSSPSSSASKLCVLVYDPYFTPGQDPSKPGAGVAPGSARWRHFPNYTTPDPTKIFDFPPDNVWFNSSCSSYNQGSVVGYSMMGGSQLEWTPHPNDQSVSYTFGAGLCFPQNLYCPCRFIDAAFPYYHQIECEAAAGPAVLMMADPRTAAVLQSLTDFQSALWANLKLNWEYALNGLNPPAQDWQVLVHTIRNWNKSHDAGTGYDLYPSTQSIWTPNGTTCSGIPPWYAQILVGSIISNPVSDIMSQNNQAVHINTGAKKNFTLQGVSMTGTKGGVPIRFNAGGVRLGGLQGLAPPSAPAASTGMSAGTKVALTFGAIGAIGLGALYWYARTHHMTMKQAVQTLTHRHHQQLPARTARRRR